MKNAWEYVHPKDTFSVTLIGTLTREDYQTLAEFYQPVIGMTGFTLYHALTTFLDVDKVGQKDRYFLHADILNQLDIDLQQFYLGRQKLEGIGLLKVYQLEEKDKHEWRYQLQPPLSAIKILQDPLLATLLLEKIGERRFNTLSRYYQVIEEPRDNFKEVTESFVNVYQVNHERVLAYEVPEGMTEPEVSLQTQATTISSFDWQFFNQLIASLKLDERHVTEHLKPMILSLHQLYGLNELTMKTFVEASVNFETNQVDLSRLQRLIVKRQTPAIKKSTVSTNIEEASLTEKEQLMKRYNQLEKQGYTEGERQVIMISETLYPMVFLEDIKQQKQGFVSEDERWVIRNLVNQTPLSNSVINILVHYCLVIQNNPVLES
ncbi:MAG: DnaD domain protein, partial [Vagococcus sp.]|nr:DnaD domain protein [Vagococcus sp.]